MHWLRLAWSARCTVSAIPTHTRIQTHAFLLTHKLAACVCFFTSHSTLHINFMQKRTERAGAGNCFPAGALTWPNCCAPPQADLDVENSIHVMSIFLLLLQLTPRFFIVSSRIYGMRWVVCVCVHAASQKVAWAIEKKEKNHGIFLDEVFMALCMRACDNQGRNRLWKMRLQKRAGL
jgi:hypothetical protein